jgi:UDP-N-acetylmuramoylalanine--D-glutamate ligase
MIDSQQRGNTLVVGLGATGLSAAKFLAERNELACVIDSRAEPPGLDALRETHPEVPIILESLDTSCLDGVERLVLSPGLSVDLPLIAAARERGIAIASDIELFARAADAPVVAVTGSNGKSTVVTLAHQLLGSMGLHSAAGGNLGPPALDLLAERPDVFVLEISSFQMETTDSLHPKVAALLNVSADHLDRHGSLERYAALKRKLIDAAEMAVFNQDDDLVRAMGLEHPRGIPFSTARAPARGYGIVEVDGARCLARDGEPFLPAARLRVRGRHNEGNVLAALALAEAVTGRHLADLAALEAFTGLPHRCEWIAERDGATYINDSKGTNVGAAVAALEGLDGPFVLIAGGQSKGANFAPLARHARGKLAGAVLLGEAAAELEQALAGICATRRASDMGQAVAIAAELASPGVTVLLSPACASFDQFADYIDRGQQFAASVRGLAE